MAESVLTAQDSLCCPICLDLLKDPVTIPCGHSYCLDCINGCWNQDDKTGVYSCPQCRQTFTPRPVLNKNTVLAEMAETLRKTRLQAAPPADTYARPGDVECDVCTGTKHKAVKSCLVCMASYCKTHIQAHYESAAFKKHKLVEASINLQEKICSHHDKLLEIFCRTDQKFICYLCVMDEHSGHKTVSTAAERNEKQKQLLETQRESQQRIQQREKELQDLRQTVASLRVSTEQRRRQQLRLEETFQDSVRTLLQSDSERSAQTTVEDSEKIFTDLIVSIEKKRTEVKEQIRAQEEAEVSLAKDLQKKLEQEIADLKRRNTEVEQLLQAEDHIHFLQSFQPLSVLPKPADLGLLSNTVKPHFSIEKLKKAVSGVKKEVEKFDKLLLVKLSGAFTALPPKPKTREDFLKYSRQLTLDPNTAYKQFHLSERYSKVTVDLHLQDYPDHPERFDEAHQVLCREPLSERCYWEAERKPLHTSTIAVCYKDIKRKGGSECKFGSNHHSWSLFCFGPNFLFTHNNNVTKLPVESDSSTIGVYVDHSAGILSFYSVSDKMTLLHTVQTTFTKPLYAGFEINGYENFIQICSLN